MEIKSPYIGFPIFLAVASGNIFFDFPGLPCLPGPGAVGLPEVRDSVAFSQPEFPSQDL